MPQKFPNIKLHNKMIEPLDEEEKVAQDIIVNQQQQETPQKDPMADNDNNKSPPAIPPFQLPTSPQLSQNEDEESDEDDPQQAQNYKEILSYFSPRWKGSVHSDSAKPEQE